MPHTERGTWLFLYPFPKSKDCEKRKTKKGINRVGWGWGWGSQMDSPDDPCHYSLYEYIHIGKMLGKGLSLYISGVASIFFPSLFSYLYTGSWTGRQTQFNNAFQLILKHSKKKKLAKIWPLWVHCTRDNSWSRMPEFITPCTSQTPWGLQEKQVCWLNPDNSQIPLKTCLGVITFYLVD